MFNADRVGTRRVPKRTKEQNGSRVFDRGAPKSVFRIGRFRAENVEIEIVTSDINNPYVIITIIQKLQPQTLHFYITNSNNSLKTGLIHD